MTIKRLHRGTFSDLGRDDRGRLVQCCHHYLDTTGQIRQYREERVYPVHRRELPMLYSAIPAWQEALNAERAGRL